MVSLNALIDQYGAAMSEFLLYRNFEWIEDFSMIAFLNIPDDSSVGFMLVVDLEYPEQLHDSHKDLPLYPEHFIALNSKCEISKLMTTLLPKKNYIVHYRNSKLYSSLGVKLTKIHSFKISSKTLVKKLH